MFWVYFSVDDGWSWYFLSSTIADDGGDDGLFSFVDVVDMADQHLVVVTNVLRMAQLPTRPSISTQFIFARVNTYFFIVVVVDQEALLKKILKLWRMIKWCDLCEPIYRLGILPGFERLRN